uniref:Uncharacterized protein n=1 Tax=Anguilla anguilla TaxID=7936 RepID=A0A0E9QKW5_ANGAN
MGTDEEMQEIQLTGITPSPSGERSRRVNEQNGLTHFAKRMNVE